jgi:multiple sugar transport system permease protein
MATTTLPTESTPRAELAGTNRTRRMIGLALTYVVLVLVGLVFVIPMAWMVSTSFKPKSQWFSADIRWIPKTFTLDNYKLMFDNPATPIGQWFMNSLMVGALVTVLILIIDSLAAYAYARMEFKGRGVLFSLLLATLFLPGMMFLVPNFLTIYNLHLLNNYAG